MRLTRDSAFWWVSIVGSIAVGLSTHFELFPWMPPAWRNVIELTAFIYGIVSGKMATSPLPGKHDDRHDRDDALRRAVFEEGES